MALSAAAVAEALLVMGTIESSMTWNAVDYNSNIKIGIAQWQGGNAAALLGNLDAVDKALLAQTLTDDLTTYASENPFWLSRFLTKDEGNSVIDALGTLTAQATQRTFFESMLSGYAAVMTDWGCKPEGTDDEIRAFLFLAAVYHVSIVSAAQIAAAVGGVSTTNAIYDAIMNKPEIATARRWIQAKAMLDAWDGTTPATPGEEIDVDTDPGGAGESSSGIIQVESQIQRIGENGQHLIIYGEDNETGIVCFRTTNNFWIPASNTAAPPTPTPVDPPPPPEPAAQGDFERMRQLWYDNEERWVYGWGPGRLDPESSGYSDCSGTIYWAVNKIRPDLAESLGVWTPAQVNAGSRVTNGLVTTTVHVDEAILRPGDILLVSKSGSYQGSGDSHVEWYFGNGVLWGAGFAPLPHHSADSVDAYLHRIVPNGYTTFEIRRFL